MFTIFISVEAG